MRGLPGILRPKPTLTEAEVQTGLRNMVGEAVSSIGYASITTSGFLAAYALILGANNFQVGVLAAIPFLAQPLQIPVIAVVEKLRTRKAISVVSWFISQSIWIPIALLPLLMDIPSREAVYALLGLAIIRSIAMAVTNCAWNSWVRDLVPQEILGRFYARRLMYANLSSMAFGLGAALFVDYWRSAYGQDAAATGYAIALLSGALTLGFASVAFMTLMPEPMMQQPTGEKQRLRTMLSAPLRDKNYSHLLRFHFLWGFALNLAVPFFAVYMIQRIGLPISAVLALSVLSQAVNALFLRTWGPLADRLGSKVVLQVTASLYLLVIIGWVFTTMPDRHFLTIPLLVLLHVMAGVAAAGVNIGSGIIGMKLAPQGQATSYLAVAALAANLGAGLGPLVGGQFADFFDVRSLEINIRWADPSRLVDLPALSLEGFDFLFGIAFVLGLMTVNSLTALREQGEAGREVVMEALLAPMRRLTAPMSSVPGLGAVGQFPYGYLSRAPVPGLDVALGVTAYQIAEAARAAAIAAVRGRRASERLAHSVEGVATRMWKLGGAVEAHGREVARQVTRGAVLAVEDTTGDIRRLAHQAVLGTVRAFESGSVDTGDALFGAAYGALQGTLEAGGDVSATAGEMVAAARELASESSLSEADAVAQVAGAAVQAAEDLAPDFTSDVVAALREAGADVDAAGVQGRTSDTVEGGSG